MDVGQFIDRWKAARGGAERANYQMFLTELCEARIEQRVTQALQTLVRYAEVTALPNGTYAARRAA